MSSNYNSPFTKYDLVSGVVYRPQIRISDQHIKDFEALGHLDFDEKAVEKLNTLLNDYDYAAQVLENGVLIRDSLERLKELQNAASVMKDFFHPGKQIKETGRIHKSARDQALLNRFKATKNWQQHCDFSHHKFRFFKQLIDETIFDFQEKTLTNKGNTPNINFGNLLKGLLDIYETCRTDKDLRTPKKGTGKLAFIKSFIEIIPDQKIYDLSNGWTDEIQENLKKRLSRLPNN